MGRWPRGAAYAWPACRVGSLIRADVERPPGRALPDVFTRPDGKPINPNYATTRFRILVRRAGLPPVRLHDLRHGAASLAHEAGADLKTLQDLLGHSSIVVTADTYTSVLPQIQRRCADAPAQLVLNAARRARKKIKASARKNRPDRKPTTSAPAPARPKTGAPAQPSASRPQSRRSCPNKPTRTRSPGLHPRRTHLTPTVRWARQHKGPEPRFRSSDPS
ncbi:site-specific integrase [Micromonospora sp. NPDC050980]|uniref:site-specific integrase n=1 Tax=Micromonospora sp. NPDC050980 TaxID=3155161 RepID=UPI0033F4A7A5